MTLTFSACKDVDFCFLLDSVCFFGALAEAATMSTAYGNLQKH